MPHIAKEHPLENIAGWVAPVATMIAAMMTAANLGARVTGWGFVVFTLGSICWSIVGVATGQTNLIATNGILTVVNLIGIWRWLGRQRAYEDGGKSAAQSSRRDRVPTLFTATGMAGMAVSARDGTACGKAVEALIECHDGSVSYVVVASGGVGGVEEQLRAVARQDLAFADGAIRLQLSSDEFAALPTLADGDWPAQVPPVADSKAPV